MIAIEDDITGSLPETLKLWTLIIAFGGFTLQVIMTFMAIRKPEREPENRLKNKSCEFAGTPLNASRRDGTESGAEPENRG